MKNPTFFLLIIFFSQSGFTTPAPTFFRKALPGLYKTMVETHLNGQFHKDEVTTCITQEKLNNMSNYASPSCSVKHLKDTPTEAVAEVRCTKIEDGAPYAKITQTWSDGKTKRGVVEIGGSKTTITQTYQGPCVGR